MVKKQKKQIISKYLLFFLILFSFFLCVFLIIIYFITYIFFIVSIGIFFYTCRLRIELIRSALSTELKRGTSFSYLAVHLDAVVEPRLSSRIAKGLVDTGTIDLLNDNNRNTKKKKKKVKLINLYIDIFVLLFSFLLCWYLSMFFFFFSSLSIYITLII